MDGKLRNFCIASILQYWYMLRLLEFLFGIGRCDYLLVAWAKRLSGYYVLSFLNIETVCFTFAKLHTSIFPIVLISLSISTLNMLKLFPLLMDICDISSRYLISVWTIYNTCNSEPIKAKEPNAVSQDLLQQFICKSRSIFGRRPEVVKLSKMA